MMTQKKKEYPDTEEKIETTIQNQENLTVSGEGFLVPAPVTLENEKGFNIPYPHSGGTDSESAPPSDPAFSSPSSLQELSDGDFEQCLEDSEWSAIQQNLALLERQSLGRVIKDPDCFSFPTLTSGARTLNSRPAGQTKCEQWFKDNGLIPSGSQLSAQAMALSVGFPEDYLDPLSPPPPIIEEESEPDTLQVEASPQPKQRSPSKESFTSTHSANQNEDQLTFAPRTEFKAISLWQPWASLLVMGLKHWLNMSWKTDYRGKLVICSAKKVSGAALAQY